ncbi:MAG: YggS family pyridoxal phosphate-dependent enzyme [Chloroflexia bacterium]|nr:YggS family pyridoxal phosphate-dependent enzyme [Chloroflexia bacterium]
MLDNTELDRLIRSNLEQVRSRIAAAAGRAGRDPSEVMIVAITKSFPVEVVRLAVAAGLKEIGENRVQEAGRKRAQLADLTGVRWHMVGHLQRNKAKDALELFDLVHSLDSKRLAEELERRAAAAGRVLPVLVEVNVAGEESKWGFSMEDEHHLLRVVEDLLPLAHLRLEGLMTVAPLVEQAEKVRPVFRRLWQLRQSLRQRYPEAPWTHLSMGMTDDYEVAVEEGATMVRLGRALFGPR